MSLAAQRKNDGEALQCLAETSETYPGSHIFTAHVLARRGETAQARRHLETYLAVAPASEQAIVKDWLLRLEPQAEVTAAR